jgi:hypothetical protein
VNTDPDPVEFTIPRGELCLTIAAPPDTCDVLATAPVAGTSNATASSAGNLQIPPIADGRSAWIAFAVCAALSLHAFRLAILLKTNRDKPSVGEALH